MTRAVSIFYWSVVAILALLMFPLAALIWLVTAPFDRRRVVLHQFTNFWGSLYTWLSPAWSVRVEGREHIQPGRVYVAVANHQSTVDIFAMHRLFWHFKWVSKEKMFRVPLVGWNMRLNRYVPIRRGDRDSVLEMFELCRQRLREGSSVVLFPEGTRSHEEERMKPFKPGAFELAHETGHPVLPIAIQGALRALPPYGLIVSRARIRLTVLPEIPAERVAELDVEGLTQEARDRIATYRSENPWPPASAG